MQLPDTFEEQLGFEYQQESNHEIEIQYQPTKQQTRVPDPIDHSGSVLSKSAQRPYTSETNQITSKVRFVQEQRSGCTRTTSGHVCHTMKQMCMKTYIK